MDILAAIKAISQAAADAYDGGEEVGLRREVDDYIKDPRVMDGFRLRIQGDVMEINYHSEMLLDEIASDGLDVEVQRIYRDIMKYLRKQFKSVTGNQLRVKKLMDKPEVIAQSVNPTRTWIQAKMRYEIQNYDIDVGEHSNILEENKLHPEAVVDASDWRSMTRKFLDSDRKERTEALFESNSRWLEKEIK